MHFIEKKGLLFMKQGSKIGIVCCSNGLRPEQAETIKMLVQILEKSGLEVDLSPYPVSYTHLDVYKRQDQQC